MFSGQSETSSTAGIRHHCWINAISRNHATHSNSTCGSVNVIFDTYNLNARDKKRGE
jgi:hypothetical protein